MQSAQHPFVWIDPASIPPRKFLYGRHLVRQFVSTTIAHGGDGKTALETVEALAMTSNLPLLGMQPSGPLRVWYWNGEDPRDEIKRRVMATALHYELTPDSIGQLYVDTGREMPIIIAEQARDGARILVPVVDAVIRTIQEQHIDAVIIDPFVSSHRVTENDNNAIELVVKKWAHIADVTNCAIELVHHSRKTGADVTVQDSRGASALLAAARSARVLNVMSEDEASQAGVENRKWYFRVDNGKANLAPPVDKASWFKFVSVALGNGDDVGVPTPWRFPNAFDDVTAVHLRDAQKAVAAGGPWRENQQASDWVGKPIARVLKLNPDRKADKKKISTLLKVWIENGSFVCVSGKDPKRRDSRTSVEVGQWAE
jgi:AAA domain